jgi:outer membrane receptor protein involved in Fe transport
VTRASSRHLGYPPGPPVNVDQTLSSKVAVKVSSVYNRSAASRGWDNNCNNYACAGYAMAYIPSFVDLQKRNEDGTFPEPDWGVQANPVQTHELAQNEEQTNRFSGGATLTWEAVNADKQTFKFVAGGGMDVFDQVNTLWSPNEAFYEKNQAQPGTAIEGNGDSKFFNWNLNGIHVWRPGNWSATTSFGFQFEDRQLKIARASTVNLIPGQQNVGQGTTTTAFENLTQERTQALYAQEEVRLFSDKLLLAGGVRAERSSVNGDVDKYYVFPKVSGSYRFQDLLGRAARSSSARPTARPATSRSSARNSPPSTRPQYGQANGFTVNTAAGNPSIEPERLKEIEVGIDGSASNGRISWEITAFDRNTTNLLLQRVPAPSTGFTSQLFNGGKIQNRGLELGLGITPIQSRDMQWVTRATWTSYTSEVKEMPVPSFRPPQSGFGGLGVTFIEVGKPLTQIVAFGLDEAGNRTPSPDPGRQLEPRFPHGLRERLHLQGRQFQLRARLAAGRQRHRPHHVPLR